MKMKHKALLCILAAAVMTLTACERVEENEHYQTSEEVSSEENTSSEGLGDILNDFFGGVEEDTSSQPGDEFGNVLPEQTSSEAVTPDSSVVETENNEFLMPNLIGMTLDEANETYSGYLCLVPEIVHSEVTKNQIFEQQYPEGRKVKIGTMVTVKVSKGIRQVEIQDLENLSLSVAENKLIKDGFKVKKTYIASDEVAKDFVIRTAPAAHELADQGSTVVLFISLGSEDTEVIVPDLVKLPLGVALKRAEEYFLDAEVQYVDADGYEKDTVVEQSLEPGSKVDRGTMILLEVSTGDIGEKTKKLTFSLPKKATGEFEFRYFVDGVLDPDSSITLDIGLASSKTLKYEVTGKPGETKLVTVKVTSLATGMSGTYLKVTVTFPEDGGKPTAEDEVNSKIFEELS